MHYDQKPMYKIHKKRRPFSLRIQTLDGSIEWVPERVNRTSVYFKVKAKSFTAIDKNEENTECVLGPDERIVVNTGFVADLLPGWEIQIRTDMNLAIKNGLSVLNSPGTFDCSYTDEIKLILINNGEQDVIINQGDVIAHMTAVKIPHIQLWHTAKTPDEPEMWYDDDDEEDF